MTRLTVTRHSFEREQWEKTSLACPKCGERELWRCGPAPEANCNSLFSGILSFAPLHVCGHCKQTSRLSLEQPGPRVMALLRQLELLAGTQDEEAQRMFREAMQRLGVVRREEPE